MSSHHLHLSSSPPPTHRPLFLIITTDSSTVLLRGRGLGDLARAVLLLDGPDDANGDYPSLAAHAEAAVFDLDLDHLFFLFLFLRVPRKKLWSPFDRRGDPKASRVLDAFDQLKKNERRGKQWGIKEHKT